MNPGDEYRLPPPRPGYIRDADPEGRWEEQYGEGVQDVLETRVVREWNIPAILVMVGFLAFGLPIAIILWSVALSWL